MTDIVEELKNVEAELEKTEKEIQKLNNRKSRLGQRIEQLKEALNEESVKKLSSLDWENGDYPWTGKLFQTLQDVFKMEKFRVKQLSAINATMKGHDVLLIMPTGGGKSLCYQLPALLSEGITLVISPLVSLMEDQLGSLERLNIRAAKLDANSTKGEVDRVQKAMADKKSDLKMIYVTPEKLAKSKRFMTKLQKMYQLKHLARIAVDEVHCCSQWGHDFRPDYKFLGVLRSLFPTTPIIGLTATATSHVINDVQKMLNMKTCIVLKASFNRPNLYYEVRPKPATSSECLDELVELLQVKFANQSGIIYTTSVKDCDQLASELRQRKLKVEAYHAQLQHQKRSVVHNGWRTNRYQAVVATIAFGMGIDKPDVRFVIHHSISKSMENFYQESGRAGRDDERAHCIVFWRLADIFRLSAMVFTEQTGLQKLYTMIEYCLEPIKCRRQMIASHFDEEWESCCNGMCDHCNDQRGKVETLPLSSHFSTIQKILERALLQDTRLTVTKLIDAWLNKGPTNLRLSEKESPRNYLERDKCESVIAYLLLKGYLKEDFHFTPYSTISYLVLVSGKRDGKDLSMKIAVETANTVVKSKSTKKVSSSSSASTSRPKKSRVEFVTLCSDSDAE